MVRVHDIPLLEGLVSLPASMLVVPFLGETVVPLEVFRLDISVPTSCET